VRYANEMRLMGSWQKRRYACNSLNFRYEIRRSELVVATKIGVSRALSLGGAKPMTGPPAISLRIANIDPEARLSESHEPDRSSNGMAECHARGSHSVVGIGASAGGLEALTLLIHALPAGLDCSFVIVQHLSPNYRSMLVQLMGRETDMPVKAVEDGDLPQPGAIYITPPNWNLQLREGRFALEESRPDTGPRPSVNLFFKSLAEAKGESAMGVILSATGSDGALGMRAIKANDGITFVQDPGSAKYPGMPQSAISTRSSRRSVSWWSSPTRTWRSTRPSCGLTWCPAATC
jgi:chemotaxis response regulator CheB